MCFSRHGLCDLQGTMLRHAFPKNRPYALLAVASLLLVGFAEGCRGRDPNASSDHLKAGLLALDQGNEAAAETELNESLAASPTNADARIALASIYATRAGFPLKAWLDPLLEAGKQVDQRMRYLDTGRDTFSMTDDSDRQINDHVRADVQDVSNKIASVSGATIILMDIFDSVPKITSGEQLADLDRAIQILRDDNSNPDLRNQKVRIYIAALGMIRLIHFTRHFVGGFSTEARHLFTTSSRLCTLDATDMRQEVNDIRDSLIVMEEGLRVRDEEATTDAMRARQNLHEFVVNKLLGQGWNDVDKFFEKGSAENNTVMRYASRICGVGSRPGAGQNSAPGTADPSATGGTDLGDPDAP